jgi:AcrR family transcriptional regulator
MAKISAGRKGRPTADDSREKLALVLDVAREEFTTLGYRAATMRSVADKAQVSTRTLYNRYADKLSLFAACLDHGASIFPLPDPKPGEDVLAVLRRHALAIPRALSSDTSLRFAMLVYREGVEFPELLRAAEENQRRYLVRPLAIYLQSLQLDASEAEAKSRLFISMALSQWQQRTTFRNPLPSKEESERHAAMVAEVFFRGCQLPRLGAAGQVQLELKAG